MGELSNMSSNVPQQSNASAQQASSSGRSAGATHRSGYNAKAMQKIRSELQQEQQKQHVMQWQPQAVENGHDEDYPRHIFPSSSEASAGNLNQIVNSVSSSAASNLSATSSNNVNNNNAAAPALPPRMSGAAPPQPPRASAEQSYHVREDSSGPPPLPPPRQNLQPPPPTPPRGTTPPPLPSNNNNVQLATTASANPQLMRRMSPVTISRQQQQQQGMVQMQKHQHRGTSPVTGQLQPVRPPNSREHQQQVQQVQQRLQSIPPENWGVEPPPPYPMGPNAGAPPPPPSYAQSLALRQSPTLSSTSSDYRTPSSVEFRKSPAPRQGNLLQHANSLNSMVTAITTLSSNAASGPSPVPVAATPSPASSMLSSSSSMQAWSARQTKTQSPVVMHSVKSTHVQRPVLQTATAIAAVVESKADPKQQQQQPPPSYEFSIQQKHSVNMPPPPHPSSPSASSSQSGSSPVPTRVVAASPATVMQPVAGAMAAELQRPPPPPYPSTHVASLKDASGAQQLNPAQLGLVSGTPVAGKQGPVISTAKVVQASSAPQRKYSLPQPTAAALSLACSAAVDPSSASRSDSPVSDSATISASPLSFEASQSTATDSGLEPSSIQPSTAPHHHTSPKPERRQLPRELEETRRQSRIQKCSAKVYKTFMELRVENVRRRHEERMDRRLGLEKEIAERRLDDDAANTCRLALQRQETNYLRLTRAKVNKNDFVKIKKIGQGYFGEVDLVLKKEDQNKTDVKLYAMKTLSKSQVMERDQITHVIAEKDILAEADNDWIVKLFYSFQDKDNLYFVMEYVSGGDFMNLLIKEEIFSESWARFYMAELILAVESVHALGYVHRDIKPDNILIDKDGHIKLTDFGLSTGFKWSHDKKYFAQNGSHHSRQNSMDPGTLDLDAGKCSCPAIKSSGKPLDRRRERKKHRCRMAHTLVGTPNYMAPEVLSQLYSQACDWWSVGVIFYEMIVGRPPFQGEDSRDIQFKIRNWRQFLRIPDRIGRPPHQVEMTPEARDLVCRLICDEGHRLGGKAGTSHDIKLHPFFKGVDWDAFNPPRSRIEPPYIPDNNFLGLNNFDDFNEGGDGGGSDNAAIVERIWNEGLMAANGRGDNKNYIDFSYAFTFRRFFDDAVRISIPRPLQQQQQQQQQIAGQPSDAVSKPVQV